jgi:hypothetical protein
MKNSIIGILVIVSLIEGLSILNLETSYSGPYNRGVREGYEMGYNSGEVYGRGKGVMELAINQWCLQYGRKLGQCTSDNKLITAKTSVEN